MRMKQVEAVTLFTLIFLRVCILFNTPDLRLRTGGEGGDRGWMASPA